MLYKRLGKDSNRLTDILVTQPPRLKILIVFWHGIGDVLMFLPLFRSIQQQWPLHEFNLGLLPGVGQAELVEDAQEIAEEDFLKHHDIACVIDFDMVEGSSSLTKMELCEQQEIGIKDNTKRPKNTDLLPLNEEPTRLVGVHLQGTCLPNSTNPDKELAAQIWQDIIYAGFIPIDLHFEHTYHNPVNELFTHATRHCRDLYPSLKTLSSLIQSCYAVVAVASGPFVMALANDPERVIYLEKGHSVDCYIKGFKNTVSINNYDKYDLQAKLQKIVTKLC